MTIYKVEKYIAVSSKDGGIPRVYDNWASTILESEDLADATRVFRELETRQTVGIETGETILVAYTIEQADRTEYDDCTIDKYVKTIAETAHVGNEMWCWG